jgi:hypothetical protein
MTFELTLPDEQHVTVTCCWDCPSNKTDNAGAIPFHYCKDTLGTIYNKGNLILFPQHIPKWCPHVNPD